MLTLWQSGPRPCWGKFSDHDLVIERIVNQADHLRSEYELGANTLKEFLDQTVINDARTRRIDLTFQNKFKNYLETLVKNKNLTELVELSKNRDSYLIRDAAKEKISKILNFSTFEKILENAIEGNNLKTVKIACDFVADNFSEFIKRKDLYKPSTIKSVREYLQSGRCFENLITGAIFNKSLDEFNFLMHEANFIETNINKVFTSFTLLQSAAYTQHMPMINRLLELGASSNLFEGQTTPSPLFIAHFVKNRTLQSLFESKGAFLTVTESRQLGFSN